MSKSRFKVVWGAVERNSKTFWSRIGLAWESQGATFVRLHAFPLSGRLCIKDGPADAAEVELEQPQAAYEEAAR